MNTQEREQVRLSILRYGLAGVSERLASSYLRGEGLVARVEEVALEMRYLAEKGFLAETVKAISPENRLWRTTAAGRDFLAMQGNE